MKGSDAASTHPPDHRAGRQRHRLYRRNILCHPQLHGGPTTSGNARGGGNPHQYRRAWHHRRHQCHHRHTNAPTNHCTTNHASDTTTTHHRDKSRYHTNRTAAHPRASSGDSSTSTTSPTNTSPSRHRHWHEWGQPTGQYHSRGPTARTNHRPRRAANCAAARASPADLRPASTHATNGDTAASPISPASNRAGGSECWHPRADSHPQPGDRCSG